MTPWAAGMLLGVFIVALMSATIPPAVRRANRGEDSGNRLCLAKSGLYTLEQMASQFAECSDDEWRRIVAAHQQGCEERARLAEVTKRRLAELEG